MKIINVNFSGSKGGAAIAAMRLHRQLLAAGATAEFWCGRDPVDLKGVRCLKSRVWQKLDSAKCILSSQIGRLAQCEDVRSFNFLPSMLTRQLNRSDADVVHLHWINAEMISLSQLAKIKKPVVWTFHDMWPFCGAEHYTTGARYISGYQKLGDNDRRLDDENMHKSSFTRRPLIDLDRWTFLRKQKRWEGWTPQVVCVSQWLADCVHHSALMSDWPVDVIYNGLDLRLFEPKNKALCRRKLSLPTNKKLILFGGASDSIHPRKGGDLLAKALQNLRVPDVELVVFGADCRAQLSTLPTHRMGSISQEKDMADLYNACDVMCVPSRMETFGQTAAEPLACGIPVVAFAATGLCEVVDHKVNGYLAQPYDTADFCFGIDWVLRSDDNEALKANARGKAMRCFDGNKTAMKYMEIYKKITAK